MALQRIHSFGWGVGEKLTSAQQNALDIRGTYALDKRIGQTDILGSVVSLAGPGRIVDKYALGADADTTYFVSGPNGIIDVASLTADRVYTLSNADALAGDKIDILNRAPSHAVIVKDGDGNTLIELAPAVGGGGESSWATFLFTGIGWVVARSERGPVHSGAIEFTSPSTWVNGHYTLVRLIGCGGGGGGGGGAAGANTGLVAAQAGAGGGSPLELVFDVIVTPRTTYEIVPGTGGNGGPGGVFGGVSAGNGLPGEDTIFRVAGGDVVRRFPGAQGGWSGRELVGIGDPQFYAISPGGAPVQIPSRLPVTIASGSGVDARQFTLCHGPGFGGDGKHKDADGGITCHGAYSLSGYAGGNDGIPGPNALPGFGGAGGGGGAAGPYGPGGRGGNGGDASSTGPGGHGANGETPAANTGAGGGGGGAGGAGVDFGGNGGAGGAGSSGRLILIPLR